VCIHRSLLAETPLAHAGVGQTDSSGASLLLSMLSSTATGYLFGLARSCTDSPQAVLMPGLRSSPARSSVVPPATLHSLDFFPCALTAADGRGDVFGAARPQIRQDFRGLDHARQCCESAQDISDGKMGWATLDIRVADGTWRSLQRKVASGSTERVTPPCFLIKRRESKRTRLLGPLLPYQISTANRHVQRHCQLAERRLWGRLVSSVCVLYRPAT
jgi:hypothetical protein